MKSNFYESSSFRKMRRLWVSVANEVFFLRPPLGGLQEGPFSGQFFKNSSQIWRSSATQWRKTTFWKNFFRWQLLQMSWWVIAAMKVSNLQYLFQYIYQSKHREKKKQILVFSRLDFLAFLGFFLEIRRSSRSSCLPSWIAPTYFTRQP